MKKTPLPQVAFGATPEISTLISEASRLHGSNNPVWRAQVASPLAPRARPMIIKWVDGHLALCVELACALAAQALRLPVPAPGLIVAHRDFLPGLPLSIKSTQVLLIGSEYKHADALLSQALSDNPAAEEFVWNKLCASESGSSGAAWDELVANDDRHYRNSLFDGANWWLFDHDRALTSSGPFTKNPTDPSMRASLRDFNAKCNILADQMVRRFQGNHNISAQPTEFARHKAELSVLSGAATKWAHSNPKIQEIFTTTAILLTGIELRLPPLAQHIQVRIEQPSSQGLWTSTTE